MKQKLEKMKQFLAKNRELFFLITLCVIIFGIGINIKTVAEDELWNFQNVYKIYNGYKIYIDVNVITTPFFHVIGVLLFKILGANFFIFKLYGILINILIFLGGYLIFKSFKIPKLWASFLTILLIIVGINVCHNTANYNNLCLMFVIYGVLILINRDKFSDSKFIILQSIITFLILLTKQNIGIIYFCSLAIYNLLFEKDKRILNIIKTIVINIILSIIVLIIMYKLGILEGFISYAILGIKEFAMKNISIEGAIIEYVGIASITIISVIIINFKKLVDDEKIKNINILSCFAFPLLAISYPIFNVAHIDLSLFLVYIILFYMIYLFFDNVGVNRNILYKIAKFLIILLSIIGIIKIILYFCNIDYSYEYNNLYFGSLIEDGTKDKIKDITDYICDSEEKVILYSTEAAFYMMPLNISNGSFDLPLLGNFGKDGEIGIIKEISEMSNTKIMINKEKKVYQESDMVIQYIKENLIYIGEIYDFVIYKTKE